MVFLENLTVANDGRILDLISVLWELWEQTVENDEVMTYVPEDGIMKSHAMKKK